MKKLITCVLFLVSVLSYGNALECYKCDSSQSFLCNIGLAHFVMPTVDCSKEEGGDENFLTSLVPKQCVKLTAKDSDGKDYVARGCIVYTGKACDIVMRTLGFFSEIAGGAKDINCYTCDGDKCNSSLVIKPSIAATFLLSVIFLLFKL